MDKNNFKNIFLGPNKYTVGMIFMFANLAGFFTHMRKLQLSDGYSFLILLCLSLIARLLA